MAEAFPDSNTSGNTRETKVKTFLSKPPKRFVRLVMAAKDEEGDARVLAEWQKEEVRPELTSHILDVLADYATEVGGAVRAHLIYLAADGAEITSMLLNLQANKIETPLDAMQASVQGDSRSLVVQAQVQSLAIQKMYLVGAGQLLSMSQAVAQRANDQAEGYLRRIVALEFELDQLKEALRVAESIASAMNPESGESGPIAETQQRMLKLLEAVIPTVVQRLMAPPSTPLPPPS